MVVQMEEPIMVKNFNNEDFIDEEEIFAIINDFIEENILLNIINDFIDEDVQYLRVKEQELRWLAAKTRFRGRN